LSYEVSLGGHGKALQVDEIAKNFEGFDMHLSKY
jgi:hypothetical protein